MCLYQIVSKYYQAILHHIGASRAYTLRAKHVIFKVRGSILITYLYVISSQDGTVQEYDYTVSYTHKSKCVLSCCR